MGAQTSAPDAIAGLESDENSDEVDADFAASFSDPDGEENDWDEYGDEIASARAFNSWQNSASSEEYWDEDEETLAAEREEAQGSVDRWEDWAAVDEIEDDESYQWSESEEDE